MAKTPWLRSAAAMKKATKTPQETLRDSISERLQYLAGSILTQAERGYFTFKTGLMTFLPNELDAILEALKSEGYEVTIEDENVPATSTNLKTGPEFKMTRIIIDWS